MQLESSIRYLLREREAAPRTWTSGGSIIVEDMEPLGVAAKLEHTPGVSWIAAGLASRSFNELLENSATLARNYLKRGDRFSLDAEGSGDMARPDVAGGLISRILESSKGTRVSLENPKIRFRTAFDGPRGVVGVEIARGPGGIPTGVQSAACLVSGGRHSSVVAWMALLAGYKVRLVHALVGEESLLGVARLYAELSHRTDPRGLMLQVVEGKSPSSSLMGIVRSTNEPVFGGFHASGRGIPRSFKGRVVSPLYLMSEEMFDEESDSLALKSYDAKMTWASGRNEEAQIRSFGGVTADVSEVVDGLS